MDSGKVDVFMPLYVSDLLKDTDDLSLEEFGAYTRLLCHMWSRGGSLPNDPERLSRLARVDRASLDRLWPVVGKYFRASGASLTQKRLALELAKARTRKAAAVERAQKGGQVAAAKRTLEALLEEPLEAPPQEQPEQRLTGATSPSPSESTSLVKRQEPNAHARVLAEFCVVWRDTYGESYEVTGKDKSHLGRMLQALSPERVAELPRMFRRYLQDKSHFVAQEMRHALWHFCHSGGVNKYRVEAPSVSHRENSNMQAAGRFVTNGRR